MRPVAAALLAAALAGCAAARDAPGTGRPRVYVTPQAGLSVSASDRGVKFSRIDAQSYGVRVDAALNRWSRVTLEGARLRYGVACIPESRSRSCDATDGVAALGGVSLLPRGDPGAAVVPYVGAAAGAARWKAGFTSLAAWTHAGADLMPARRLGARVELRFDVYPQRILLLTAGLRVAVPTVR